MENNEETKKSTVTQVTQTGWEVSYFGKSPKDTLNEIRKEVELSGGSSVKVVFGRSECDLLIEEKQQLVTLFINSILTHADSKREIIDIINGKESYRKDGDLFFLRDEAIDDLIDLLKGEDELYPLFTFFKDDLFNVIYINPVYDQSIEEQEEEKIEKFKKALVRTDLEEESESSIEEFPFDDDNESEESESGDKKGKGKGENEGKEGKEQNEDSPPSRETLSNNTSDDTRRKVNYESICELVKKEVVIHHPTGYRLQLTEKQVYHQKMFSNMLDISFESKPGLVQSLRTGKLDVNKISESMVGNFNIYERIEEEQDTRPFSVCILMDESGSMGGDKRQVQLSMVKSLYKSFEEVLPPEKIFVYGHTSTPLSYGKRNDELLLNVYNEPSHCKFETSIEGQRHVIFQQNYDSLAVEEVYKRIREVTSDRIILIVTSDGQPGGYHYGGWAANKELKRVIEKCKRDDFVTVGIGIQDSNVKNIYQYYTIINDLSDFPKYTARLLTDVIKQEFKD